MSNERRATTQDSGEPAFRQSVPSVGLSIERGTNAVPRDGRYYVLLAGEQMLAATSKQQAMAEYRKLRDSLVTPNASAIDVKEALGRQVAEYEADAFLSQSSREKRARATRKGGKGGSGGVGR